MFCTVEHGERSQFALLYFAHHLVIQIMLGLKEIEFGNI